MGEYATFPEFEKNRRIISEERKIPFRIMGEAIRTHCLNQKDLYERLKRGPKHDMDFVTYSKYRPSTRKRITDLGFES
ncbi:MAG: hypothetical protein ABSF63_12235 [Candidatus Bathyarchaeia archaeon]